MAQLKSKQIRFSNPGDIIVAGDDNNGSILSLGKVPGQALVVKNVGTEAAPKLALAYDIVSGSLVSYDDTETSLGASTVQDAIVKLKSSVSTALVYTGTVDASNATFSPELPTPLKKGTYYQVSHPGSAIPTNNTGAANEAVLSGDAVVWNGQYWDVVAHIDAMVSGTSGEIAVTGNADIGYTVSIDKGYIGQTSLTTLGTITTGIWNGTKIDLANGGTNTNLSTVPDNSIIFKEGTGVSVTTPVATNYTVTMTESYTGPFANDPAMAANIQDNISSRVPGIKYTIHSTSTTENVIQWFSTPNIAQINGNIGLTGSVTATLTSKLTGVQINITGSIANQHAIFPVAGSPAYPGSSDQLMADSWTVSNVTGTGLNNGDVIPSQYGPFPMVGAQIETAYTITSIDLSVPSNVSLGSNKVGDVIGSLNYSAADGNFLIANFNIEEPANQAHTFLSFDPNTGEFVWVTPNQIFDQARKTHFITEEVAITAENGPVQLSNTPVDGSVQVFVNGLKLGLKDYTVAGQTVTLVPASIGYNVEATDVIDVSYNFVTAS